MMVVIEIRAKINVHFINIVKDANPDYAAVQVSTTKHISPLFKL